MPFTNTGVFERLHNWEEDRINGIEIVTDHHDAEDDNFASGLSQTMLRDGRTPMSGQLNMGGFKITNIAPGVNASDAVTKSQLDAIDQSFVPLRGDAVISDVKEFLISPLVPTVDASDNSNIVASTRFTHQAVDLAFEAKKSWLTGLAFPTYQTVAQISSGYVTPNDGFVIFNLPPRMVGSIEIGAIKKSFAYNYNNTQPSLAVFPIAKGVTIKFSGCTAEFTSI